MEASAMGYTAIVKLLLEAGADKEAKDGVRETRRKNHTHTYTLVVDKMIWRVHTM